MKQFYSSLLFAFIFCGLSAQNYEPFNENSVKTFTTYPTAGATFSLGFDSTIYNQGINEFYPYKGIEDYEIILDETCAALGENLYCFPESKPNWLGSRIIANIQSGIYTFETNSQSLISVNFSLPAGTSVVLYEDAQSRFSLTGMPRSSENIWGVNDSVSSVLVSHTDLNGNPVSSPLNDFIIKTGKESGLITFFRIDSFPQILEPVIVIADQSTLSGFTQITNEDLYDYQAGDQLQYNEKSEKSSCHTEVLFDRFVNLTFLQRTDTQDSIIYTALRETFQRDSLVSFFDTTRLAYARQTVVAQMPYDYNSHNELFRAKKLSMEDYCGDPMWTYRQVLLNYVYCEESQCWGIPYSKAALSLEVETNVMGIGRYYYTSSTTVELDTYVYTYQLNYFKKANQVCGDEQIVSTNDLKAPTKQLIITPNPSSDYIQVTGAPINSDIRIINLNGQVIRSFSATGNTTRIYVGDLEKGIYIVKSGSFIGKALVN